MRPDRAQQLRRALEQLGRAEEHDHPPQRVLEAAARLDLVEHRRQQRPGHEGRGDALARDRVQQRGGLELGVVHQDAAGAADQVRVERLEPARPLDRVEVEVDVVGGDRRDAGAERVEVVQVVGDHGLPRAVGLDPRLRVAGGPRRQLQEARRVLVDVQQRVLGRPAGLQLAERHGPVGHVRADRGEHADAAQFAAARVDDVGEPRVEDERLRLDVVEHPCVRLGSRCGCGARRARGCASRSRATPRRPRACCRRARPRGRRGRDRPPAGPNRCGSRPR